MTTSITSITSITIKSRDLADGSVRWSLYFRPAMPDGTTLKQLPQFTRREDRPAVEKIAESYRDARGIISGEKKPETCDEWYDRFVLSRRGRVSTADTDHKLWAKWISPVLGRKAIVSVTADDCEAVRDALEKAITTWEDAGRMRGTGLAYASAANVWAILALAMKHASTRKGDRALRVREPQGNPCTDIRPPRTGDGKRRHWLRPAEVAAYLAHESTPIAWRVAVAIGLYLHLRPGELQELRVRDVDLEAGEVSISRAVDGKGKHKAPKTREGVRTVTIPDTLLPLLEQLVDGADPNALLAPIVGQTTEKNRARVFRAQLEAAGIKDKRPELFTETLTHEPIDFRTIRDTGITWRFLAGHRAEVVQREAGHEELTTTLGYAKEVADRGGRYGQPFPPVPISCERDVNRVTGTAKNSGKIVARVGFEPTTFGL